MTQIDAMAKQLDAAYAEIIRLRAKVRFYELGWDDKHKRLGEAEARIATDERLAEHNSNLRAALEEIASHWDGYVLKGLSAADVMGIVRRGLDSPS